MEQLKTGSNATIDWITSFGHDKPSHTRDVDATNGPANEQSAEVFDALPSRDEFAVVGNQDGNGAAQPAHTSIGDTRRQTIVID